MSAAREPVLVENRELVSHLWTGGARPAGPRDQFFGDGDNPIAQEGPCSYEHSERAAGGQARTALRGRRRKRPRRLWHAMRRGPVVDSIGDGHPYDCLLRVQLSG